MRKPQRLTPRQDHHPPTTYAQRHRVPRRASAVLQPTKLRTRSIIGWHGTLRRHIHGMLVVILMQANHVSVQPNNSFKLSPDGMSRWPPSAGPAAHFALAVQRATPSVCQLNSNVRLHSRRSRAALQQSQRLRREPNTTTRQEPRETGQHAQALSSGALSRPKTKDDQNLGSLRATRAPAPT